MHQTKRISIKSATVAGIASSALWALQVSPSIQRQPTRSCTALTRAIPEGALPAQASCSGRVPLRALRFVITPEAT